MKTQPLLRATSTLAMAGALTLALSACSSQDATDETAPATTAESSEQTATEPSTKELVVDAATAVFTDRDLDAIDEYFSPDYVQHSTLAADGVEGLRAMVQSLPEDFRYEPARVIAQDDTVVLHGTYYGFAETPLVAFDVFRVEDQQIVEHWDSLTPLVEQTASWRSQVDGPTEPTDAADTDANAELVSRFAKQVLVGQDYDALPEFISTDTYAQHNPEAADGLDGFAAASAAWAAQGKNLVYTTVHQVIAEGDLVFTYSEGDFGGPAIYADLWRVQDGKIVEHWDAISPIPAEMPHTNGAF
ncbi:nuclear transport factor 2 family protein [Cellulosimicrobium funkei]|uniref:nuclear transport factor 2 family protein n=1 Tax=Cellulosimicrobium funkei TaxID=264251 RepID=UPI00369BB8E1